MPRKILVLVREGPLNQTKHSEAFRVALGLTLTDNAVTILFAERGVGGAGVGDPDIVKRPSAKPYWDNFTLCGVTLLADADTREAATLREIRPGVKFIGREEILAILAASDMVVQV